MTEFWFVRHGQSVANAEGWYSGWVDTPLTPAGEAEAEAARAVLLAGLAGGGLAEGRLDRCLVSDLQRARRTAAILLDCPELRGTPVHVLPELRERCMGSLAGVTRAQAAADGRWAALLAPWEAVPPGGESHRGCLARVVAGLRAWSPVPGGPGGRQQRALVVGHGGWMRDLFARLDGIPPEEIGRRPPAENAQPICRRIRSSAAGEGDGWPEI